MHNTIRAAQPAASIASGPDLVEPGTWEVCRETPDTGRPERSGRQSSFETSARTQELQPPPLRRSYLEEQRAQQRPREAVHLFSWFAGHSTHQPPTLRPQRSPPPHCRAPARSAADLKQQPAACRLVMTAAAVTVVGSTRVRPVECGAVIESCCSGSPNEKQGETVMLRRWRLVYAAGGDW